MSILTLTRRQNIDGEPSGPQLHTPPEAPSGSGAPHHAYQQGRHRSRSRNRRESPTTITPRSDDDRVGRHDNPPRTTGQNR